MELAYYLLESNLLQKDLAKRIGILPTSLSPIRNKKRSPSLIVAMKIHFETNGAVSLYELLSPKDKKEISKKYGFVTMHKGKLRLRYYLWENNLSQKAFAKKIEVAIHTLNDIVLKKRSPSLIVAMKIHCETNGIVCLYDLLTLEDREEIKKYSEITSQSVYNPDRQNDTEQSRRKPGPENEDNAIRNRPH